jgi:hypothetical protein
MIGCAGKTSKALQAVTETTSHDLTGESKANYTVSMDATVAFLRGDKVALIEAGDAINAPPSAGANGILNLKMICGVL